MEVSNMSLTEVLSLVEQLTPEEQMELYRILAGKLESSKLPFPFQPKKIYYVCSPYDAYGAARLMREAKERK